LDHPEKPWDGEMISDNKFNKDPVVKTSHHRSLFPSIMNSLISPQNTKVSTIQESKKKPKVHFQRVFFYSIYEQFIRYN